MDAAAFIYEYMHVTSLVKLENFFYKPVLAISLREGGISLRYVLIAA